MSPPARKFTLNGKEYRHSQYYALKKKYTQKKAAEYQKLVASQFALIDEWKGVLAKWHDVESTVRMFEDGSTEPSGVGIIDGNEAEVVGENVMEAVNESVNHPDVGNVDLPSQPDTSGDNMNVAPLLLNERGSVDTEDAGDNIMPGASNFPPTLCSASSVDSSDHYLPPIVLHNTEPSPLAREPGPCALKDSRVQQAKRALHNIFTVHKAKSRLQNAVLKFMKETPQDVLHEMPSYHTSLRPARIPHKRYPLHPGEMIYFGIANVLTLPSLVLFDQSKNVILLSVSTDGVPLCSDGNGVGLWPLSAAVEQYPVFLIGVYCGKSKPECPNAFMRPLVHELIELENKGLHVPIVTAPSTSSDAFSDNCGVRVYAVRMVNLIMDLPALAYVTCIIGHAGADACPRCTNPGSQAILASLGLTKKGKQKKGVRYAEVYDAAPRMHEDFRVYFKHCLMHNLNTGHLATDCCSRYSDVREECDGREAATDILFEGMLEKYDVNDPSDVDNQSAKDNEHIEFLWRHHRQQWRKKKKLENEDHVTILFLLKHFDIIKDVPIEYMHAVCLGVMRTLLVKWTTIGNLKIKSKPELQVSARLTVLSKCFPIEFQRKPEGLQCLKDWKATQFRSFLLYVGVVALDGILDTDKLHHFHVLVTAMRTLICRVDNVGDRDAVMKRRAKKADALLRFFIAEGVHLYGEEFASLKIHLLVHIVEDYMRFGPLDLWSAFRFESFLAVLKAIIYAHRYPAAQIINAYSSLLQTGLYGKTGDRGIDSLNEYFEQPVLKYMMKNAMLGEWMRGHSDDENELQCYKRLYVKSFVIRTDNEADSCCVVKGNVFLRVRKIVRGSADRIYLCGNTFDQVEPLYCINIPDDDDTRVNTQYTSNDVGVLRGRLTQQNFRCEFGDILQKVYVAPRFEGNECFPAADEYALLRFLH